MRGVKVQKANVKCRILEKTGGVCAVCGRPLEFSKVTIEHYIPKFYGGTDDERNLLPLCRTCNRSKGSRLVQAKEHYPYLKSAYIIETKQYQNEWENGGDKHGNS